MCEQIFEMKTTALIRGSLDRRNWNGKILNLNEPMDPAQSLRFFAHAEFDCRPKQHWSLLNAYRSEYEVQPFCQQLPFATSITIQTVWPKPALPPRQAAWVTSYDNALTEMGDSFIEQQSHNYKERRQ